MNELCRRADMNGWTIKLYVSPLGGKGAGIKMTRKALGDWYRQFGFGPREEDSWYFYRDPKHEKKRIAEQLRVLPFWKASDEMWLRSISVEDKLEE